MLFNKVIRSDEVISGINSEAFYSKEKFLSDNSIKNIHNELELWKPKFNTNDIHPTRTFNGWYHSMAMAKSNTVYDIVTSDFILDICRNYFEDDFRLKSHRVYSIYSGASIPWHSDNKIGAKKHNYKGLVFIFYLKDVFKGQFQAIKNSEKFSKKFPNPKIDQNLIERDYSNQVVDFKLPAGSFIVYNDKTIHRAKPYFDPFWYRTSLFIQIDQNMDNSEKIILNPSFIKNIDDEKKMFLGFGKKNDAPHEPVVSGLFTLSSINLISLIIKSVFSLLILKPYYLIRRNYYIIKILKLLFK